jgi:hypothetical protein
MSEADVIETPARPLPHHPTARSRAPLAPIARQADRYDAGETRHRPVMCRACPCCIASKMKLPRFFLEYNVGSSSAPSHYSVLHSCFRREHRDTIPVSSSCVQFEPSPSYHGV